MDGPWVHHQQRAHRLTSSQPRPASATQYGAHEHIVESIGTRMTRQLAPPPVSLGSMGMPDSPSPEEDSDEGSWDTLPYRGELNHNPYHVGAWNQTAVVSISLVGTGMRYPVRPTERVCHMRADMWPYNLHMMHGCRHALAQLRIWQKCKTFRAKGAIG